MTVRQDPENNEIHALRSMADFAGANVLEIGCGDGRLTWRYAGEAASVTAIDPFEPSIRRAKENAPAQLRDNDCVIPVTSLSTKTLTAEEKGLFDGKPRKQQ